MTILIVGAGIGGLTAALSLHQIGIEATVYESVETIEPLGVGINVLPHAVRELSELGLADELRKTAIQTSELAYYSPRGQLIWREPRGLEAGYRWPQYSIHRGSLQMLLLDAARARLGKDRIVTGHHLTGFEETNSGVTAHFIDKRSGKARAAATGSLLIGADGMHSRVRAQLVPGEGQPIWSGYLLWRGMTEAKPFLSGRSMIMACDAARKFVSYPITESATAGGSATLNWIAERTLPLTYNWRREQWNRQGRLEDFLPEFLDWRFDWLDVPDIIQAAPSFYEYPMVDRDPLELWTLGPVSLLGDAAHPMYPVGSNGASQAILDARVLAREIKRHGLTTAALEAYEAERRPPTTKLVLANRQKGPEQVMYLVAERAPEGFEKIEDVLTAAELAGIAGSYKHLAGFDVETLNNRPPIVLV